MSVTTIRENFLQMTSTLDDNTLPHCIASLLNVEAQMKILHWQTEKYAEHKAFNTFGKAINAFLDDFVESYQGKHGRIVLVGNQDTTFGLYNYEMLNEQYIDLICDIFCKIKESIPNDSELLNIVDEGMSSVNRLKYLLTLE
jgi:hypothetical protein